MEKVKLFIIIAFLIIQSVGWAQTFVVESFDYTTSVEARTHKRLDSHGIPCALIKVRCLSEGLRFTEAVGVVENYTNEYWVFVPDKSTSLTIYLGTSEPFVCKFADYGSIVAVESNVTYTLKLLVSNTASEKRFSSQSIPGDFQDKAQNGDAEAECNLGKCLYLGQGTTQNYYVALTWFRKAAEKNWSEAQYYIGRCYYYGQGFPKLDYYQAVLWYRKAAEQNYADAQYQLGLCYEKGQGVKQDMKTARKWYERAATNGNAKALQKIR